MDDTSVFEQIEGELPVVKIQFGTSTGQLTELMLNDQGRTPDVTESDGIYAGATMLSPDTLKVAVVIGETQYKAGDFELVNDGAPKDLDIQQQEEGFALQLSTGTGHNSNDASGEVPGVEGENGQEQQLVDGMLSVAEDISTGNQPLPPIEDQNGTSSPSVKTVVTPKKHIQFNNYIPKKHSWVSIFSVPTNCRSLVYFFCFRTISPSTNAISTSRSQRN